MKARRLLSLGRKAYAEVIFGYGILSYLLAPSALKTNQKFFTSQRQAITQ